MTDLEPADQPIFTHREAWTLGRAIVERSIRESLAVTISISLGEQRLFHAAMEGTSADNDFWVAKKAATVRRFDASSQAVYERYAVNDPDFLKHFGLRSDEYVAGGGAVPIRVRGSMVGVLAISGLASEDDHALAIESLTWLADQEFASQKVRALGVHEQSIIRN